MLLLKKEPEEMSDCYAGIDGKYCSFTGAKKYLKEKA